MRPLKLAIVGAAGAVGKEILRCLDYYEINVQELRLFGGQRSSGKKLQFRDKEITIETTTAASFQGADFALFSAGSSVSREYRQACVEAGCILIDNSSAFRMEPETPLVIPEVNPDALKAHKGVIANPNCSTIIMLMALEPLRRLGAIKRVTASTYQAASGAGQEAMDELAEATRCYLAGESFSPEIMPVDYAFNFFSHNSPINEFGRNEEEQKMILESKKILSDPNLQVFVTCIRVPVLRAHGESLVVEFEGKAPSLESIYSVLSGFPGLKVKDDRQNNQFPTPRDVSGQFEVELGRIRHSDQSENTVELFVVGDQLLKGAAQNAVQIMKELAN